jgi:cob(I)alamin adenosyltransferase
MNEEDELTEAEKDEAHRKKMVALKEAQDREVRSKTRKGGVLIVNTGDGKGKSTAAFGTAIRAAGHGQRVAVVQFTKGKWKTGEQAAFARFPEIDHFIVGDGFTWNTQDRRADIASAREGWALCVDLIEACRGEDPKYRLLVIDELNIVLRYDYLPVDEIVAVLARRPEELHVIVTGRDAKPELVAIADTVTEMRAVKHAYEAGIKAQRGIEF